MIVEPVFRNTLSATHCESDSGTWYDVHDAERTLTVRMSEAQYETARKLDGRRLEVVARELGVAESELAGFVEELARWNLLRGDPRAENEFDSGPHTVLMPVGMAEVLSGAGATEPRPVGPLCRPLSLVLEMVAEPPPSPWRAALEAALGATGRTPPTVFRTR